MAQRILFTKMHGTGNDYVYIDCFNQNIPDPATLARVMSPRRFSIGADGVILICPSDVADAKMRMFNLDGSEGRMCGNGVRCVGKYIFDNKIAKGDTVTVETLSGVKTLKIESAGGKATAVTVDVGPAVFEVEKIPVRFDGAYMINQPIAVGGEIYNITAVSVGNPHAVTFCEDVKCLNLNKIGPLFEAHPIFPQSVNTEFIRVINQTELEMRVYERGSGETFACGTGACAAVAAAVKNGFCPQNTEVTVHLLGGDLYITYQDNGNVIMRGGAEKVFEGVFEYEPEN